MRMGTYTLDGVPLDDPAGRWGLSDETLLGPLPAPVLSSTRIPGVHGAIPTPPLVRDAGSHTVGLIVTDNNAAGEPTGDHQQLRDNYAAVMALAAPVGRLPELRYYPDAGNEDEYRSTSVRLLASVAPEMPDPFTARVVLPFDLPLVFWRDASTYTISSDATSSWTETPAVLDGTTGSITDAVFLFQGPLTSVMVMDVATGRTVQWTGTVNSGSWLRIYPGSYMAFRTVGEAWGGGDDVSGGLAVGPAGFDLNPDVNRQVSFWVSRTGDGINRLQARRSFL